MSAVPRLLSSVLTESHEYRMSRSIPSLWLFLAEFACFFFVFLSLKAFHGNSVLDVVLTLLASWQIHPTVSSNCTWTGVSSWVKTLTKTSLAQVTSQQFQVKRIEVQSYFNVGFDFRKRFPWQFNRVLLSVTYSVSDGKNHFSTQIRLEKAIEMESTYSFDTHGFR